MLMLQATPIMGGCHVDVISPAKCLEHCDDGGSIGAMGYISSSHVWIFWRQLVDWLIGRAVD